MTNKEKIQRLVSRFDDDIPLHVAVERMALLKDIEESLAQVREGELYDHDAFMAELDSENEEIQARVDAEGKKRSSRDKGNNRARRTKGRTGVR